jgi:predicted acetyltransferase
MAAEAGESLSWLPQAAGDFESFAAQRGRIREIWDVPTTELWFTDGPDYLGTVMIRHELTDRLRREGGHIGYHVVPAHRRRGHATAMLGDACSYCRAGGMTEVLLTCKDQNIASRRVIEANGGVLEQVAAGTCHYWIRL